MKKILSIDGGGIRGIIPSIVLDYIEVNTGRPISDMFDMVVGTSTGGIISLLLSVPNEYGSAKYSASDILCMYTKNGNRIFERKPKRLLSSLWGSTECMYNHDGLNYVLREYLGDNIVNSTLVDAMVTSYDIENRCPFFFKSWNDECSGVPMTVAARATSAAPTYFMPLHLNIHGVVRTLVDGGIFVNNPALSAYAEAKRIYGNNEDILLVSLGTGEASNPIHYEDAKGWGKLGWSRSILPCVFDASSDAVDYQCDKLLGDGFIRLQTRLSIASDDLDDASEENIINLKKQAHCLISQSTDKIERIIQLIS